jgi:hypothetical protein
MTCQDEVVYIVDEHKVTTLQTRLARQVATYFLVAVAHMPPTVALASAVAEFDMLLAVAAACPLALAVLAVAEAKADAVAALESGTGEGVAA